MTNITKAIIPVAGWGTRRLPITKAIEKCMLPVGNRPIVDYVAQDCIKAGIRDVYFVVSAGSSQLQAYYSPNETLERYLVESGKEALLPLVRPADDVQFHFIEQPNEGKYGTAIPVALAMSELATGEGAAVLMGDDFIYNPNGESETARLLAAAGENGSAMTGVEVPREHVGRYGVLELNKRHEFVGIVEKPAQEDAPSTLINVSKYVMSHELLQRVAEYAEEIHGGEYFITEPINRYVAAGGSLKVVPAGGRYLDSGTVEGWLEANRVVLK